jgi:hypothetical protein
MKLTSLIITHDTNITKVHEAIRAMTVIYARNRIVGEALMPLLRGRIPAPGNVCGGEAEHVEEVPFLFVGVSDGVGNNRILADRMFYSVIGDSLP